MRLVSDEYQQAEIDMAIPPVDRRGHTNENPKGIGFWALVAEDFRTHNHNLLEQGFWAIFWHRFGNWRMGQPKIIRAPSTLLYRIAFKLTEILAGISLWYTVKLGRRVRIWHHSGMVIGCRAIGNDVHLRQNTTIGVGQTWRNDELPIIRDKADIGAGACIAGAVCVGESAKIGANALVVTDVPAGATVIGNPAQVVSISQQQTISVKQTEPEFKPPVPAKAESAPAVALKPMRDTPVEMGMIALLSSANLDYLAMSFRECASDLGLLLEPVVPEFGMARMELLKEPSSSSLQQAMTGDQTATLIVERAEDVLGSACTAPLSLDKDAIEGFLDDALQPLLQIMHDARTKLRGPIFVLKLEAFERSPLGLADGANVQGRAALLHRANEKLITEAEGLADVHFLDTAEMIAEIGYETAAPGEFWHMGRLPFSETFNRLLARRVLGGLLALRGKTARILMIDLDNTLWGGVLGEDGIEGVQLGGSYPGTAYKAFQTALRALADRGIALALTSKNDTDLALRMIEEHPEMVLRPSDFVAHRIDWTEKALNIQEMLDEIGLGAGSCLFIDDNPVEREKVRKNLPDCIVPDFPTAPEKLVPWLLSNPYLECLELTTSDLKRTRQYKTRSKVNAQRRQFENIDDFYRDMGMRLTFEPFGPMNQQRVLQLFAKTNQFNATTRRHDAQSIQNILNGDGEVYAIGVEDRHSEYELMGVMILRPDTAMAMAYSDDTMIANARHTGAWWIDSFLMSCRILGRTIEQAILAWASQRITELGGTALIGQIIETPRNTPVRKIFATSGFQALSTNPEAAAGGIWIRDLAADGPVPIPDYFEITLAEAVTPVSDRPASTPAVSRTTFQLADVASTSLGSSETATLAAIVRQVLRIDTTSDLATVSMDTVEAWDSLNHLKLMMEVERGMGVRLPGEVIADIRDYTSLANAIAAQSSHTEAAE